MKYNKFFTIKRREEDCKEMSNLTTTTNLYEFGSIELIEAEKLIKALRINGLPKDFYNDDLTIMLNLNSGNVFFTNSDCQVAMCDNETLFEWFVCCNCGNEGAIEDICNNPDNFTCNECNKNIKEYE